MKRILATLMMAPTVWAGNVDTPAKACALSVDEIVTKMNDSDRRQDRSLPAYSAERRYTLHNPGKDKKAIVTAHLDYTDKSGKVIKIVKEEGADGLFRRVIRKVLDAEVETSKQVEQEARIDQKNYNFQLLGTESLENHKCYVLQLHPKRASKFLIAGKLWVSSEDFGVVRIEGRPSGSLGFWVGKPYITQSFKKVGPAWFLTRNESVADVKLIGRTELTIEGYDINIAPAGSAVAAAQKRRVLASAPAAP
jgi:outer membrane lipoprotein-sorting protein